MDSPIAWIEHLSVDVAAIKQTAETHGMHPLALEDCLKLNQRAKFDDYENHQLLVWFICSGNAIVELEFVIFPRALVLIASAAPPQKLTWKEYLDITNQGSDVHHLLYQALDKATDISEAHTKSLYAHMAGFENDLFKGNAEPMRLLELKKELARAAFAVAPLESVISQWQRFLNPKDDLRWRMRDLIDHCQRIHNGLVFHQSQIASTMDMYWGLTAKRTNDQIKKLSVIASVSVPLTVWSSFWGMNFQAIPFDNRRFFFLAIILMMLSVGIVAWFFKSKGFMDE
jgi:magnesium transporter